MMGEAGCVGSDIESSDAGAGPACRIPWKLRKRPTRSCGERGVPALAPCISSGGFGDLELTPD